MRIPEHFDQLPLPINSALARLDRFVDRLDGLLELTVEESEAELQMYPQHHGEFGNSADVQAFFGLRSDASQADYLFARDVHFEVIRWLPRTVWGSVFLSSFALVEHSLTVICERLAVEKGLPFTPNPRETSITDSQGFLKKVGIKFPDQDKTWTRLRRYNDLRNVLIHEAGRLLDSGGALRDPKRRELLKFIQHSSGIEVDEDGYVELRRPFVTAAVADYRSFFHAVFDAVIDWLVERSRHSE